MRVGLLSGANFVLGKKDVTKAAVFLRLSIGSVLNMTVHSGDSGMSMLWWSFSSGSVVILLCVLVWSGGLP